MKPFEMYKALNPKEEQSMLDADEPYSANRENMLPNNKSDNQLAKIFIPIIIFVLILGGFTIIRKLTHQSSPPIQIEKPSETASQKELPSTPALDEQSLERTPPSPPIQIEKPLETASQEELPSTPALDEQNLERMPPSSPIQIEKHSATASQETLPTLDEQRLKQLQTKQREGYYVQLGAFSNHANASAMIKKLSLHNRPIHIVEKPNNIHAVWAGPYSSRSYAEGARDEIYRLNKIKGYVTQHPTYAK